MRRLLVLAALALAPASASTDAGFEFDAVLAAIERVESSGRPWSIQDNSTGRAYALADRAAAEQLARELIDLGHNLDLGLYQINSLHLRRARVSLATVFDPTVQRDIARAILAGFLERARAEYGDSGFAWQRAIGAYNCGSVRVDNAGYVARVLHALGRSDPPLAAGTSAPVWAADEAADAAFDPQVTMADAPARVSARLPGWLILAGVTLLGGLAAAGNLALLSLVFGRALGGAASRRLQPGSAG